MISEIIYKQFPLLENQPDLIYVDNAATTQKPKEVIAAIVDCYERFNAPVKRAVYTLAELATASYENAREVIAQFINADSRCCIFTKNATDSINMVAFGWALFHLKKNDEIVITALEHHANILPWIEVCKRTGAQLKIIPVNNNGILAYDQLDRYITAKTKLVSFIDRSHALGITVDASKIITAARAVGARVLMDVCQSVPHRSFLIPDHNPDFAVFSAHKMMGPTNIGLLYVTQEMQEQMQPVTWGGGMAFNVKYNQVIVQEGVQKFEAGILPLELAIGFKTATEFLKQFSADDIAHHEKKLTQQLLKRLSQNPEIRILVDINQLQHANIISFVHKRYHAHDVGAYLNAHNICVRTGNYCAQPLSESLHIDSAVRISIYLYNTLAQMDYIGDILQVMQI